MKKLITAIAMTASLGLATSAHADELTLAGILLSDGDMFDTDQTDFDIVTQALLSCSPQTDGLVAAASNPDAELTVFLPTDKAFRILVEDAFGASIKDEATLFGAVAGLGCGTVAEIVSYHIVPGVFYAADVLNLENGTSVGTVLMDDMMMSETFDVIFKGQKGKGQIRLADNEPALRDPIVRVTDIMAANGVAHVVDRVLLPFAVIE